MGATILLNSAYLEKYGSIAPANKHMNLVHFQEAPFLSCGHPSPKGGRIKRTAVRVLAPSGGKWRVSAERGLS